MKNKLISNTDIEKYLTQFEIQFVNRSYGKTTTGNVSLDTFIKIIKDVENETEKFLFNCEADQ